MKVWYVIGILMLAINGTASVYYVDNGIGDDGHDASGVTPHPGELAGRVEMGGGRIGIHQVESTAFRENGVGRGDAQQAAVFLIDDGLIDCQMSRKVAGAGGDAAVIVDRRAAVHLAETLGFHASFPEFLSEIEHERRGVEQERNGQGGH